MKYIVKNNFFDKTDMNKKKELHRYNIGDAYPRARKAVDEDRAQQLLNLGFIEEVEIEVEDDKVENEADEKVEDKDE